MTNKEAIEYLESFKVEISHGSCSPKTYEAINLAIEALKDKGYNAGYQEGYEAGTLQGSQTILNGMKNVIQIVPSPCDNCLRHSSSGFDPEFGCFGCYSKGGRG